MTSVARQRAEHLIGEPILHVATNAAGDVAWLGAGPAVKVLSGKLVPVVGFEAGTSGSHVSSLAVGPDAVALVSATTLELYSLVGRSVAELDLPESGGFTRAAFTGDGQTLVWARSDDDGRALAVQFIDAATGEVTGEAALPCAETIESCSVFPAGPRGAVVAGWEPDGEHCNVVARADADAGTLTAVGDTDQLGVLGVSPDGGVALGLYHGGSDLFRIDVANGGARRWVHAETSERHEALNSLDDGSSATFLDERQAILASGYEDPLLLDVGADDGQPRPLQLGCVFTGPRFVCRLGPMAFLTAENQEDGRARLRAWELP